MTSIEQEIGARALAEVFPEQDSHVEDPVSWIEGRLGERLWSKQREIAQSLVDHRFTAVQSAHATGKSWLGARLVAHWVSTHPIGEVRALTTAPTAPQIEAVIWRELSRAKEKGRLPGRITRGAIPQWHISFEQVALGRKPQDLLDTGMAASAFQGLHDKFMLVLIDEAAGVDEWLWDAADSLVTNETSRILAIGNPTDPTSAFATRCKPGSGWNVIKVSAFDTPAFTGERVPKSMLDVLVSEQWVEERRKRWGKDSPLFISKVLGEFPTEADDSLISPASVELAQATDIHPTLDGKLGVDVARAGTDRTVAYRNRGGHLRIVHDGQGHDLMQTSGFVARHLRLNPEDTAAVDIIGVGAGVYDRLREQGLDVTPFQASERATQKNRFVNRRAEAFWQLREELAEGSIDLDPVDEELASQLLSLRWKLDSKGRIQIESKEEMRKRGLPSPDRADAAAMAVFRARGALSPSSVEPTSDPLGPSPWGDDELERHFKRTGSYTNQLLDLEW